MELHPALILAMGLVTVVGLIITLRINAFIALISAALLVSFLAPGDWSEKVGRVAQAFGGTAASIGIVIGLAAVVGTCLLESGAADRIVRWFLSMLGVRRSDLALLCGGFILGIPVFFDTVIYLLAPLARSMHRRTGRHFLRYHLAIGIGAILTHTLVPPTPGPMVMANTLGVDLGVMILVGLVVALPGAVVGMLYAGWLDTRLQVPMRPLSEHREPDPLPDEALPGLSVSLLPILLPVFLIAGNTLVQMLAPGGTLATWTATLGNPNLAMLVSAAIGMAVYASRRRPTGDQFKSLVEDALKSGGLIILITAAGGAFGAMLKAAEIGNAIEHLFSGARAGGMVLLAIGFCMAALLKFAQGSATVAMITASAMMASMVTPGALGFHPAYLAAGIGCGSMVGAWMNDSGFWIFSKMGGLTEVEGIKTWTSTGALLGFVGLVTTVFLILLFPMAG